MAFHRVYLAFIISIMYPRKYISCAMEDIDLDSSKYYEKTVKRILEEHNKFRGLHGVPDLELDQNISFYAQQWVLYSVPIGVLLSRPHAKYGENLWLGRNANYRKFMKKNGLNPVKIWYDQLQNYAGRYNPYRDVNTVDEFTQVVWRSSKKLGVGIFVSGSDIYVACYYDPPGNIRSEYNVYDTILLYRKNVFPPYGVDWSRTSGSRYMYFITVIVVLVFCVSTWLVSQNRDWLRHQFDQLYSEYSGTTR